MNIEDRIWVDEGSRAQYEPWTDGFAIGFKVTDPRGRVEYIYLNPSTSEGVDDSPCVFLYQGPNGDPGQDDAYHFYNVLDDEVVHEADYVDRISEGR